MVDRRKKSDPLEDDFADVFPSERPTAPRGETLSPETGAGTADESESESRAPEERPTVSPPFNLEEFARTTEAKERPPRPPRAMELPTQPPPPQSIDVTFDDEEIGSGHVPVALRPPQITLTNEDELESARLKSVLLPSDPPPGFQRGPTPTTATNTSMLPPTVQYPATFEEKDPFADFTPPPPSNEKPSLVGEMRDRVSLGDYSGALEVAETILAADPVNAEAIRIAEESRTTLLQMYTARIGPMDRVPMVTVPREQLRWLSIDHRAGFLLSHIDGVSSLEMILDVSGMPILDAMRILYELSQQRVIAFR